MWFGCEPPSEVVHKHRTESEDARVEAVEELERGVRKAGAEVADLNQMFNLAQQQFEKARIKHEASQKLTATSQSTSQGATDEFAKAEQLWRYFQVLVELAAAVDAANLDKFRAATKARGVRSLHCEAGMSTSAFRRQLTADGVDLQGKDVDHIVPRSLGGADHPANYQLISSSLNRSLGNHWGSDKVPRCGSPVRRSRSDFQEMRDLYRVRYLVLDSDSAFDRDRYEASILIASQRQDLHDE